MSTRDLIQCYLRTELCNYLIAMIYDKCGSMVKMLMMRCTRLLVHIPGREKMGLVGDKLKLMRLTR